LRTRRNLHAPISQLPPEILSAIFILVRDEMTIKSFNYRRRSWTRVSYICRHWRKVALGCPALWSYLDFFALPALVPEMLLRSKSALLTIKLFSRRHLTKTTEAFYASLQHLSRVQELSLTTSNWDFEKWFCHANQSTPHLHKLKLWAMFCGRELVVLPRDFLNGTAPCLSYLELRNFHLHWDSPLLKNLTTLKLSRSNSRSAFLPTPEQLVEILSHMPDLEILELKNVLPSSKSSLSEVTLTRLRSVLLSGEPAGCAYALDLISFPSTARIQFTGILEEGALTALENIALMLPPISKIRRRLCEPDVILSLSISCSSSGVTISAMLNTAFDPLEKKYWMTLGLKNPANGWFDKAEAVVKILGVLTPLTKVGMLKVEAEEQFWGSQAPGVLAATFDNVHTLHVQGGWGVNFLQTMSTLQEDSTRVGAFPLLTYLELTDLDFDENRDGNRDGNDMVPSLVNCLQLRSNAQAEVERLVLRNCIRLTCDGINKLEEVVEDVDWDQEEIGFTDSEEGIDDDD
ncbi:hypothetical protein K435DRAFT_782242, partial [Dendrothele bispora CBS 962.96]